MQSKSHRDNEPNKHEQEIMDTFTKISSSLTSAALEYRRVSKKNENTIAAAKAKLTELYQNEMQRVLSFSVFFLFLFFSSLLCLLFFLFVCLIVVFLLLTIIIIVVIFFN